MMLRNIRRAAAVGIASVLLSAGVSAVLAPAAQAEVGGHCPITFHSNTGIVAITVYVTYNPCNRPFRARTGCSTFGSPTSGVNYWRTGDIVAGTGQSTGSCDWLDGPMASALQYFVNGTWYEARQYGYPEVTVWT